MRQIAKIACGCLIALVTAFVAYSAAQAQKPDKIMRVGGEITSIDETAGTLVIGTNSGPNMTVRVPQGGRGGGPLGLGSSVVVQFNQSAAQGQADGNLLLLGVGGGRRPGTVEATSLMPGSPDFCRCDGSPSDEGCKGSCTGSAPGGWTCGILEGIVYRNLCGAEQQ